jgi:large subunit ribosomal protein L28
VGIGGDRSYLMGWYIPLEGLYACQPDPAAIVRGAFPVAAVCEVCGKHPSWGMSVSHSHVRTKRRWNPNIQRVRALVNGAPRRLYVCTSCIKAGKVTKAGH